MKEALLILLGAAVTLVATLLTGWLQHRRDRERFEIQHHRERLRAEQRAVVDYLGAITRHLGGIDEIRSATTIDADVGWDRIDDAEADFYRAQFSLLVIVDDIEIFRLVEEQDDAIKKLGGLAHDEELDDDEYTQCWSRVGTLSEAITQTARKRMGRQELPAKRVTTSASSE